MFCGRAERSIWQTKRAGSPSMTGHSAEAGSRGDPPNQPSVCVEGSGTAGASMTYGRVLRCMSACRPISSRSCNRASIRTRWAASTWGSDFVARFDRFLTKMRSRLVNDMQRAAIVFPVPVRFGIRRNYVLNAPEGCRKPGFHRRHTMSLSDQPVPLQSATSLPEPWRWRRRRGFPVARGDIRQKSCTPGPFGVRAVSSDPST